MVLDEQLTMLLINLRSKFMAVERLARLLEEGMPPLFKTGLPSGLPGVVLGGIDGSGRDFQNVCANSNIKNDVVRLPLKGGFQKIVLGAEIDAVPDELRSDVRLSDCVDLDEWLVDALRRALALDIISKDSYQSTMRLMIREV